MKKILKKYNNKLIKKIVFSIVILILVYFIFTVISINHYLNKYGYSVRELPKTVAVYFRLSNGFTVQQTDDNKSTFIGRANYIYDEVLNKKGYYELERYGNSGIYIKNENCKLYRLDLLNSSNWCHWFRIYILDGGKIEDFL